VGRVVKSDVAFVESRSLLLQVEQKTRLVSVSLSLIVYFALCRVTCLEVGYYGILMTNKGKWIGCR
jgi:hypothetical protein